MKTKIIGGLIAIFLLIPVSVSHAARKIEGFEPGDPGLTAGGDASIHGTLEGIAPPEGASQFILTTIKSTDPEGQSPVTQNAFSHPGLQNFFNNVNSTTSDNFSLPDIEGSGMYFTFTLNPGETGISFSYDFLTNEDRPTAADTAFYVLYTGGTLAISPTTIATSNTPNSLLAGGSPFEFQTGYNTVTIPIASPGTYTIGIGIYDKGDGDHNSGLLIDNFVALPEPKTYALAIAGGISLLGFRRFRLKS